jgi:hydrogenase-4 component B
MLNHSLFKPLLFMGAGNLLHATRTRRMDQLGGLAKKMPKTFALMALGAVAICGLPPLNGFVSELLIYMGLFQTVGRDSAMTSAWAALAAPALAIIGALAVGAFVKLIGVIFEGSPRSRVGDHARDPAATMLAPMVLLAAACAAIGFIPALFMPTIDRAVAIWDATPSQSGATIASLIPLRWFSCAALALTALLLTGALIIRHWRQRRPLRSAGTWDCGYALPIPSAQYTGSSFAQMLVMLAGWALKPRTQSVSDATLFPARAYFSAEVPDTVLDRALLPVFSFAGRVMSLARHIQRGSAQMYVLYMLTILLALLMFAGWTK